MKVGRWNSGRHTPVSYTHLSEVSDILRKQLEGIDTRVPLDEIGTVLQVSDGVARIYGLRNRCV